MNYFYYLSEDWCCLVTMYDTLSVRIRLLMTDLAWPVMDTSIPNYSAVQVYLTLTTIIYQGTDAAWN